VTLELGQIAVHVANLLRQLRLRLTTMEDRDLVATSDKRPDDVRAHEARSAEDDHPHARQR
jgi:hypothetical protein